MLHYRQEAGRLAICSFLGRDKLTVDRVFRVPRRKVELNMSIVQAGNVRLNVVERGKGRPLLLVHGYPLDHSMWRGQIDGLADRCRLIAPDLRGFGASGVTAGTVTMEQMADDLAGLLDALKITEPIVLCGLSMGGYVAWQFALKYRARLAKLILCDTRAAADSPEAAAGRLKTADKVLAEGAAPAAEALIPKLFAPETYQQQPKIVEETRQVILRTKPEGIAGALRGMAERPDVTVQLAQLDVPALLICGEHDGISPPSEMRQIASQMPHAKFVEIANAGHMAPLEQPAAVNAAMRDFFAH
jgi:pimeloyl-ACP methyl ester carboxylesterase